MVGVLSFGRGLFEREPVEQGKTSYRFFYRVKPDHVVMSQLFGWEGALALSSDRFAGRFLSPQFPTFLCDLARLDRLFLGWLMRRPAFWRDLGTRASGMGDRRKTLTPDSLFACEIPLPPLSEQRRLVSRIEEVDGQIREARRLRDQAMNATRALVLSVLHQHFVVGSSNWARMPMEQAIAISDKQVDPTLPEYSRLPHISGENMESNTTRLLPWRTADSDGVKSNNYLFSEGTVLYSKIRPYLRKAVFVDFRGVCSADVYPIRVINPQLDPHFVKWSLVAEPFTDYANRLSGRTRMPKLNRKQLFAFDFTHPALEEQRKIIAELDVLQTEVDTLTHKQAETAAELDALLPTILDRAFKGQLQ
jgi:type I restriction enzyme S subunit